MNRAIRTFAVCAMASLLLAGVMAHGADVRLPPVQRVTLANGAQLLLVEKRDTPLISMSASIRGGAVADPAGKDGTATLFAELIQKGAGSRDAAAFAETIEAAGGELGAGTGSESMTVAASFMAQDADLMIELVADALLRPKLTSAEFAKVRELAVQSIAAAKDADPSALIGDYGDAWLFRGHPYGRAVGGSESSLAGITLEDVQRYYAEQVGGDRLIVAVVGDFDAATMQARLEAAFGGWRKAGAPLPVLAAPAPVQERRVLLVDKPGATQTYFWMGSTAGSRADPTRVPQGLVNMVFGGRFTSMLNTELRIKSGLTYGASSGFERGSAGGAFRISSFTQTGKTGEAMDLALATLDALHRQGLDAAALESSQRYVLGQFPPTLETNGQLAGRLTDLTLNGLTADDVDGYAGRVRAADAAAVRAAIDTAFPESTELAIVMIGDAAKIRTIAGRFGAVTELKLSDPRFLP